MSLCSENATLGTANECYILPKVDSTDRSAEIASLLFSVAERCTWVEQRLAEAEKTNESLKQSAASSASVFDMTANSRKNTQPKMQPRPTGMSIVNPGSRKRAKAKGVEFE